MADDNYWSETEEFANPRAPEALDLPLGDPREIGRYPDRPAAGPGRLRRVYLARRTTTSIAPWQAKVPNPERVSAADDIETYLAEARALAKLDHPNIVPVYDVGRTSDGLCYVVSRYIEGSDLSERVRLGRPTFRESVELAAVVAGALHHAHTRGLIHRDVKPANILIGTSKSRGWRTLGWRLKDEDAAREPGLPARGVHESRAGPWRRAPGRRPFRYL